MKDYYKILEPSVNENFSDIKKAYKKLATKWHPDKNLSNKKIAEEHFKEISEAYQILSDPTKRDEYDNSRKFGNVFSGGFGGFGGSSGHGGHGGFSFMGTDPFDLFNSHFGMNPFADMQKQMQMMSQHFDNMERSINSSHISPSFGSSTSTNVQYTNNNGKVSTKTVLLFLDCSSG